MRPTGLYPECDSLSLKTRVPVDPISERAPRPILAGPTRDHQRPIWARVVTARRGMHRFLPRLTASACRTDM